MSDYRNPYTSKNLTLWRGDKAYNGATKQVGRLAQDTYELWRTYNPDEVKIKNVEEDNLSSLHQKISAGVNITTKDVKDYLYSCTGMFKQMFEIDLLVSPRYTMPAVQILGTQASQDKYKDLLMNLLFSIRFQRAENQTHQDQLKTTIRKTKSN